MFNGKTITFKEYTIMWSYIIDGALILILLISTIVGIVKGFFDSLLSLLGTGISFAVAVFTAKYVSPTLNKIINIEQFVLEKLDTSGTSINVFGLTTNEDVAKFCTWLVTVIVMFLIIKLAIFILAKIFESVTKNSPTLSGINRVFGMLFGLVKGAAWVFILLAICSALKQVPGVGTTIKNKIAETKVTSFAYKYVDDFVENQLTQEKVNSIIDKLTGGSKSSEETPSDTPADETPAEETPAE